MLPWAERCIDLSGNHYDIFAADHQIGLYDMFHKVFNMALALGENIQVRCLESPAFACPLSIEAKTGNV